jgi:tetratricopeptide (TPR) repeat protein
MTGSAAAWSSADPAKWIETSIFAQIEKGDPEGAEQRARDQLRKKPSDPQALLALAASLLVSRNIELADYYASRVVAMQTVEQSSALNIQGICRVLFAVATGRGEDFDEAAGLFRKSLETSGLQVAAALNLGEMELLRNRSGDSIAAFNDAVERCNGCRPARYGLGLAAMRARQFDKARDQFKAIVKQDPADDDATYQLALAESYGFNNVDKAARMLKDLATGSKDIRVKAMAESVLRKLRGPGGAP